MQRYAVATLAGLLLAGLVDPTGIVIALGLLALAVLFITCIMLQLALVLEPEARSAAPPRCPDADLPQYGVLVPLYREARIVPHLLAALGRLDYPPEKLDIRLVLEADDHTTAAAINNAGLPPWMRIVVVPTGGPRTKPRALNAALIGMRSEFVVVYDAEDDPHPRQLRDAVEVFRSTDPRTACLQAHLAIDNAADSWLATMFALEYAALFDVLKPALARNGLPVALGGTSNHFRCAILRDLGGWDAWNVAEDADLGIRIARAGYLVGDLPSTTFEEAPVRAAAWLGQRRRWLKGWMQTLVTHSRDPLRTVSDLGFAGTLTVVATIGGVVAGTLGFPLLSGAFALRLVSPTPLGEGGPVGWFTDSLALVVFLSGACTMALPAAIGLFRRGKGGLAPWLAVLPIYAVLGSIAAWQAVGELFWRPSHWTKTEHGLSARTRQQAGSGAAGTRTRNWPPPFRRGSFRRRSGNLPSHAASK